MLVEAGLLVSIGDEFRGPKRFIYALVLDDACDAGEFLENLSTRAKAVYRRLLRHHASEGIIRNAEKYKYLKSSDPTASGLYEYKDNQSQTRLLHTVDKDGLVILLLGVEGKKENKLKAGAVDRAKRCRDEYARRRDKIVSSKVPSPTGRKRRRR